MSLAQNLKDLDLQFLIRQIVWGKIHVNINDEFYILRSLTSKEENFLSFLQTEELNRIIKLGVITEQELRKIYRSNGDWPEEKDFQLNLVKAKLSEFEEEASKAINVAQRNKINLKVKNYKKKFDELYSEKYDLFKDTAEYHAKEESKLRIPFYILQGEDEEQYWKNIKDFKQCEDISFIYSIISKYYDGCFIDEETLRYIARSGSWRYKWQVCKNDIKGLFGKSVEKLSYNQEQLIYWSQIYDSVYESLDRPPKSIIENDVKLDEWFRVQMNKGEREAKEKHYKVKDISSKHANRPGTHELFIMAKDQDEANEIKSLNDPMTKARIENEQKKIKGKDRVPESELRKGHLQLQARQLGMQNKQK